jgi:hypothetical protein
MKAFELLEKYGWCQGRMAKDELDLTCRPVDTTAISFCAVGAILRKHSVKTFNLAAYSDIGKAKEKLEFLGHEGCLITWNDCPERTKEEVIALLKELDI